MKDNVHKGIKVILIFLLFIAFGVCCYLVFRPWFTRTESRKEAERAADEFLQAYHSTMPTIRPAAREEDIESTAPVVAEPIPKAELYAAMQSYNEKIFVEGQSGLCDPWDTGSAIDLCAYGLEEDEAIGVLQIPSIDVSLPLYCGASYAHLDKGAAVLSQTSFPIGGENTNTVIGAHRGWNAEDYLRDVEEMQLGDEIIVTNFWDELHYTVTEIKIIEPDDIAQILIQPGRELLTVFTCHPYASGGRYRYLLICERVTETTVPSTTELQFAAFPDLTETTTEEHQGAAMPTVCIEGEEFESAATEIRLVAILPWIGMAILLAALIIVITMLYRKKRE